jgi:HEPN domain-containing protein
LQELSSLRLREAKLLFAANAPDGAYYLAGYAVECALKACIARSTERHDFPDLKRVKDNYTHKAKDLICGCWIENSFRRGYETIGIRMVLGDRDPMERGEQI